MTPSLSNERQLLRGLRPLGWTILVVALVFVTNRGLTQQTPSKTAEKSEGEGLINRVAKLESQRIERVKGIFIVSKKTTQGAKVAKSEIDKPDTSNKNAPKFTYSYVFPHWEKQDFCDETIQAFYSKNWLKIVDDAGEPRQFGDEVLDVIVVPHARFGEFVNFWSIEARPDPAAKNQIQIVALGTGNLFANNGLHQLPPNPQLEPCVHVDLIVIYRQK